MMDLEILNAAGALDDWMAPARPSLVTVFNPAKTKQRQLAQQRKIKELL